MSGPLYVYAILERAPRGVRLRGLAREPVRFVRSGRLVVAVGRMESAPAAEVRTWSATTAWCGAWPRPRGPPCPRASARWRRTRDALDDALRPRARGTWRGRSPACATASR